MTSWKKRATTAIFAGGLMATVAAGLAACGSSTTSGGATTGCTNPNGTTSVSNQQQANVSHGSTLALRTSQKPAATTINIATFLPVSGTDASEGLPAQYGVDLAVSQNTSLGGGYTLGVKHENYEGSNGPDTSLGTSEATSMVTDNSIIAVAGPFNSGIAKVAMPITNGNGLPMISMANTNPGLTKSQYAPDSGIDFATLHPAGKPEAYFRIPGTDDVQGKVDAQLAFTTLGCKTVYVVDDNTTYGTPLANYFTTAYTGLGGKTVGTRQHITAAQVGNLTSLASQIKSANPDVVYYGGVTSGGGAALKKALVAAGFNHPMVGGDGIADDSGFLTTAGASAATNTYGSVAAPDVSTLTSSAAQTFASDYKTFVAGKPNNDLTPYAAMAYDAAMVEITAIKSAITSGTVTRDAVRTNIQNISYQGITGQISFDANGDNSGPKVFSIYGVNSSGAWVYKTTING